MAGLIEKSLLAGLGALTMTRDRVVKFVNEMAQEGEVKQEEVPDIVDKLVARGEEEREALRNMVHDELDKRKVKMPLVSRRDIEELSQKIDELAAKVEELAGEKPTKKQAS
jgi:polyhydroxyalkanoate synthesis regulator phasin